MASGAAPLHLGTGKASAPSDSEAHRSWFGGMPESEGDPSDLGWWPQAGVPKLGVAVAFGETSESGLCQICVEAQVWGCRNGGEL